MLMNRVGQVNSPPASLPPAAQSCPTAAAERSSRNRRIPTWPGADRFGSSRCSSDAISRAIRRIEASRTRSANTRSGIPDCRTPAKSPGPRIRRSSSAIRKPSTVCSMIDRRAAASSPCSPPVMRKQEEGRIPRPTPPGERFPEALGGSRGVAQGDPPGFLHQREDDVGPSSPCHFPADLFVHLPASVLGDYLRTDGNPAQGHLVDHRVVEIAVQGG